jgi:hypothetical protein
LDLSLHRFLLDLVDLQDLSRQWGLYSQLDPVDLLGQSSRLVLGDLLLLLHHRFLQVLVGQQNLSHHSLLPLLAAQLLQQDQLIQLDLVDL